MQNLRERIKNDKVVIGSWISSASPIIAEIMAASRFDFLVLDVEHSAINLPQTQVLLQAIRAGNPDCAPLVRLPGTDYSVTKRYMDAGAAGVIAPFVNIPRDAREVVRAVKYPPEGDRGVGYCRDNDYGMGITASVACANERTIVGIQIEHMLAVHNLDDILSVPGIDVAFVGPYDLSASMGLVGQFDHPEFIDVRDYILTTIRAHGIMAGTHAIQPDPTEAILRIREGYHFIAYSLDIAMLSHACAFGIGSILQVSEGG